MKPAGVYQSIPALNLPQALPPASFRPCIQPSPLHPMHMCTGTCNAANAGIRVPQRLQMLTATQDHAETPHPHQLCNVADTPCKAVLCQNRAEPGPKPGHRELSVPAAGEMLGCTSRPQRAPSQLGREGDGGASSPGVGSADCTGLRLGRMTHREDDTRDVLIIESAAGLPAPGLGARRMRQLQEQGECKGGEGKVGLILASFNAAQRGLFPITQRSVLRGRGLKGWV